MNDQKTSSKIDPKTQYGVGAIPYHTHNGIDSPKIPNSSGAGRSHASALTSMGANTPTKVGIDTNDFASGISWNSGNTRFAVTTSGYYLVSTNVEFSHYTSGDNITLSIYKNGGSVSSTTLKAGAPVYESLALTDILSLSTNDYIEIYALDDTSTCRVDTGAFVVITSA